MRVLVTRPEPDAARTAARLEALGHVPVVAPLTEIAPLPAGLPEGVLQAVVLTSANAVRAIAAQAALSPLLSLTAFPVGARTAAAAEEAGFRAVMPPAGEGAALVDAVARACRPDAGAIVHAGGRDLAVDVAGLLAGRGFETARLVLYEARAVAGLPEAAATELREGRLDAALLYSPRASRLLLDLVDRAGLGRELRQIALAAMSERVAEPLRQAGHSHIGVARTNDEASLLQALDDLAPLQG